MRRSQQSKLENHGHLTSQKIRAGSWVDFMQEKKESSGCQWWVCHCWSLAC